ncbi:MAG: serine/threonine protein kinase [Pirellulaceae bacterium]|jgi:serine/threonine protein kinase
MKEDALFEAALEIDNAEKRQAFLDKGCKEAPALRARLEALLRAHEQPDSFFDAPPGELVAMALASVKDELVGATIGLYTLREQIGEGGMGVVYVAEQKQPVRRKVALKIIKAGMDSNQVILRFEAERQTLALMDHPNIAKIIDAGSTDAGRPYFVMELIRGIPITEYCDQTTMPMRQRLELFISVCRAVQHAHLKGIIHRDLKPSNVLVTEIDGECVPKVIDFGVAKATGQQMSEQTIIYTHFSQMIGTPIYMSPEQAGISGVDIDTRSDVYSLGVLLYELLSGKTPFDSETLRQAGFDEMRRIMREEEPPRPSVQLSTLEAADSSTISACRGLDPRRLQQIVHGELDWIVMKAVEKDRNRRYESASAFSVDIERYLANEPVIACPPSAAYRLRKFATRHKAVFLTSTLVAVALVLGTIVSLWQAQEANEAQRFAEEQRDLAQRNEAFGEQLVYAADVRLAAQAWGSGDVGHYSSLLDRHALSKTGKDLRGFEW